MGLISKRTVDITIRFINYTLFTAGIVFLLMAIYRSPAVSESFAPLGQLPVDWLSAFSFQSGKPDLSKADFGVFLLLYSQACPESIGEAAEYSHVLMSMARDPTLPRFVPAMLVVHEEPARAVRLLRLLDLPVPAAYASVKSVTPALADEGGMIGLQQICFVSRDNKLFYRIPIFSSYTGLNEKRRRIKEGFSRWATLFPLHKDSY